MSAKNQIGILGVGAIGTIVAYHLHKNTNNKLSYFSRTKKSHLKLISNNTYFDIPIKIQTSLLNPIALDWLIICLKANQYEQAQHWFSKLIDSNTKIAVIRNGLRLKDPLLKYASEHKILECIIDCSTALNTNYYYETVSRPIVTIPKHELTAEFQSLFYRSEILIQETNDFKTESWKKLCESATLGALLCLHNDTCRIFKNLDVQQQFRDLIDETITVAQADGAQIEDFFAEQLLSKILNYPDTKGSSMLTDLQLGNPLEFEAKNGIISQLGTHYQIDTPINNKIIKLLS